MNTTISTIIPFYNNALTLPALLGSILTGTHIPDEVLLIDDGSTDKSSIIAQDYCANHSFIKYYRQDHKGVSAARNLGLSVATKHWISFLDADDYIEPTMYEHMLESIADTSYDGCICGYYTDINKNMTPYTGFSKKVLDSQDVLKAMFINDNIRGFLFTRLFKAELLNELSFNESISVCEDLLFQSELFSTKTVKFAYIEKPLYHYVQNDTSTTGSHHFFKDGRFVYKCAFDKIRSHFSDEVVNKNYNSILEHSMCILLKDYKNDKRSEETLAQIRQLQKELKITPCKNKSRSRLAYEHAPLLYCRLCL